MNRFIKIFILAPLITILMLPMHLIAQEDLGVTATVLPNKNDATVQLTSSPDPSTVILPGEEVSYTVRYRLNLTYGSYPFTIDANWSRGLIENTTTYMDAMEYVVGSASNAHDGSSPVIDVSNRRISWNIAALTPSGGYHTITYKLRALTTISITERVNVKNTIQASLQGANLDPVSIETIIQRGKYISPTPIPTNISSTPSPTITPLPTTTPVPFAITQIKHTQITDTSTEIQLSTSQESSYILTYGTNKKLLSESSTSTSFSKKHTVHLSNLTPDTEYFYRIQVTSKNKNVIKSELFTFKTATLSENIILDASSLLIYSDRTFLSSEKVTNIVIPKGNFLHVDLHLPDVESIEIVNADFIPTGILGANTEPILKSPFIETLPGVLSARLQLPDMINAYNLVFNIQTKNGTHLTKIAPYIFNVSNPIIVLNQRTNEPIEGATIKINRYQESFGTFIPTTQRFDTYYKTNEKGELSIVLPSGRYIIEASALGYPTVKKELFLGTKDFSYPSIALTGSFSIRNIIRTSIDTLVETCIRATSGVFNSAASLRLLKGGFLLFVIIDLLLGIAAFMTRKYRTHITNFKAWLLNLIIISMFIFITFSIFVLFVLFSITQGVVPSLTYLILFLLNIVITGILIMRFWKEEHSAIE